MGKRGPKPKDRSETKSQVFSVRVRPDLRDKLEEAANEKGRPISEEVIARLTRTFIDDEKVESAFGNRRNYLLMRMAALAMHRAGWNLENPEADWLDDPYAFDQAMKTLIQVMEAIRPPGEVKVPDGVGMEAVADLAPMDTAGSQWLSVQRADPALPLNKGTFHEHRASMLKLELGDIANRPIISYGPAAELRGRADELEQSEQAEQASQKPVRPKGRRPRKSEMKGQDDGTR